MQRTKTGPGYVFIIRHKDLIKVGSIGTTKNVIRNTKELAEVFDVELDLYFLSVGDKVQSRRDLMKVLKEHKAYKRWFEVTQVEFEADIIPSLDASEQMLYKINKAGVVLQESNVSEAKEEVTEPVQPKEPEIEPIQEAGAGLVVEAAEEEAPALEPSEEDSFVSQDEFEPEAEYKDED